MTERKEHVEVSKDEQAIYDRQIRLWGMEAQNRIRNSRILIIGGGQLGAEVAKTISLAGVDEMHLVDHRLVDSKEIGMNFLYDASVDNTKLTKWAAAYNFLYNLNRNVKLVVVEEDILSKPEDVIEECVQNFTMVIALDESYDRTAKLNSICRKHKIRFISGAIFGWVGYAFFDFDGHSFLSKVNDCPLNDIENDEGNKKWENVVHLEDDLYERRKFTYSSFADSFNSDFTSKKLIRKCKRIIPTSYFLIKAMLRASNEKTFSGDIGKDIEELTTIWKEEVAAGNHTLEMQPFQPDKFDHLFPPEFGPTAACVGGMIGQEAIRTISEGKFPVRNIFIYSALDSSGVACLFPPT